MSREFHPEDLIDEITLSMVEGVGSLTTQRLYERFGDCKSILSASESALESVPGIGPKTARLIAKARENCAVEGLLELARRENISILSKNDARYPELLRLIYDPPPILYVKGRLEKTDDLAIAVIGTRRMSPYGRNFAAKLTRGLVQYGITILSGLARGVDGVAHRAALECGGRTVAILGSGVSRIYPDEHRELAEKILENGAILSEYHPLMEPNKGTFPQRNRIVAGMSVGVLIVEAPRKSGAMITARLAYEQGRELFAVPGNIDRDTSAGCNQLIKDGATLVESVDDIIETLGPLLKPLARPGEGDSQSTLRHPGEFQLNEIEIQVLQQIAVSPTPPGEILQKSGLESHQVEISLIVLERLNLVRRLSKTGEFVRI